jgi:branched-chain amino acid transport system permease protein
MTRVLEMKRSRVTGLAVAALIIAFCIVFADQERVQALILGTGAGALISAIALGVVIVYRGSGVVNFATGAMAMYMGYVFNALRSEGDLFLGFWPIHLGAPWAFLPALLVSLLVAMALGAVIHALIFRPLRTAPALATVVASIGLLLILQASILLHFGANNYPVQSIFSESALHLPWGLVIPADQAWLTGVVAVTAVGLWAVYRFSSFGYATRAAAENERGSILLGYSPEFLGGANWVVATVVIAVLGILSAPVNGSLDPSVITLLIVPALGAALLGGFTSFGLTTVAGFGIGMLTSLVSFLGTESWFPTADGLPLPGIKETLPFFIIAIALFVRGSSLPTRGATGVLRQPFAPPVRNPIPVMLVLSAVCAAGLLLLGPEWRLAIINSLVGIAFCLSFVVLIGYVGQISLAQMAIAGVAGFTLAKIATHTGIPFPIAPIISAFAATAVALIAAIPALRVRGVQLAVVTLAAAVAIENFVFANPAWSGGVKGAKVPPPSFLGLHFGPTDATSLGDGKLPDPWFGIFCLIVVVGLAFVVVNLRRSGVGRRMLAVRTNERAAASAGVDVSRTKFLAFGLSAFIAGIAGTLSGYRFGSVTPEYFGVIVGLSFLSFAYLGGITSVTGATIGGLLVGGGIAFTALHKIFGIPDEYTLLIGGIGVVATAVLNPEGIAGAMRLMRERLAAMLAARRLAADGPPGIDGPVAGVDNGPGGSLPTDPKRGRVA